MILHTNRYSVAPALQVMLQMASHKNDQCELKELCGTLDKKGVKFMLSNSATPFIKELYKDYNCTFVKAKRFVNPNREGSGQCR